MNIDELATSFADRRLKRDQVQNAVGIVDMPETRAVRQATAEEMEARAQLNRAYMTQNCRQEIEAFVHQYVFCALVQDSTAEANCLIDIALDAINHLLERGITGNLRNAYAA